ncbi:MAG: ABC transporter ATP-binding protein [Gemmatimonadaceae bacterium]|jgi:iron complex transport system ATP-binding protein|nr:ABC transporter ATP-binding protein [Gemmatimonadaceae bacterium]MCU0627457.1 ABC transporter ATP-binding protein [Gemmatimonadaceae bacterium]
MLHARALAIGHVAARPLVAVPALAVRPGEFICLLGRNGIGKTTLLRTLAGLHPPLAGEIRLDDTPLERLAPVLRAQRIAVVLTDRVAMPGLSARDVVELGRLPYTSWLGTLAPDDHRVVDEALRLAGVEALALRGIDDLSDGERQRVLIARALAQRPSLLLLDEITAFLDLPNRVAAMLLLRRLAREHRCAVVLSSHDLELSLQLADRLWLLPGDGRLIDDVPEAVALAGAIGAAFDQPHVRFAIETGAFALAEGDAATVLVEGDEPARFWTAQGARRLGWRTVSRDADTSAGSVASFDARVEVRREGTSYRWRIADGRGRHECDALGEALARLAAPHGARRVA